MDDALLCIERFSSAQSDTYTLALAAYAHSLSNVSSDARGRIMDLMNSRVVVQGGCTAMAMQGWWTATCMAVQGGCNASRQAQ